ncbi:hypothetical protein KKA33_01585 [Patescibacteria group bacterium]|nr:hypothetical protein [Patescibacteria group bacterium]
MGYIKIDTETGEVLERSGDDRQKQPSHKNEYGHPDPQPTTQEITEDMLREDEQRRKRKKDIIGSLTPEQLEDLISRNQIKDLIKEKPEIGHA